VMPEEGSDQYRTTCGLPADVSTRFGSTLEQITCEPCHRLFAEQGGPEPRPLSELRHALGPALKTGTTMWTSFTMCGLVADITVYLVPPAGVTCSECARACGWG
jgi:hypothetical protein